MLLNWHTDIHERIRIYIYIYILFSLKIVKLSFIDGKSIFWISGILIGIFSGPNQAASRSLMGRLTPINKENKFFGFYAFSGKATAFIGPLLFSTIVALTNDLKYGIIIVTLLFISGSYILSFVKDEGW